MTTVAEFFEEGEAITPGLDVRNPGPYMREADVSKFVSGTMSPLSRQEAGDHYVNMPIQPIVFCQRNKLGFIESCIIKRLCRYKNKDGLQDLLKAKHEIEVLISLEYGEKP